MTQGFLQLALFFALIVAVTPLLGGYMARVFRGERTFMDPVAGPLERVTYRLLRIDPTRGQDWKAYARGVILFSLAGWLLLYVILRTQTLHPFNPEGFHSGTWDLTFNTTSSFVTNTNWQYYAGETTLSYFSQMAGLAVQNFVSAATGIVVAIALIRGIIARRSHDPVLGNFWRDLVRACFWVLLPISIVGAVLLMSQGVLQTLGGTVGGLARGPVASQEAIKELGTNGGGFYNANSAHPFENPTPLSNMFEIFLLLLVPVCLTRTFGLMVGDKRQGWALLGAMTTLWAVVLAGVWTLEVANPGTASRLAGAAMEGKETRFGVPASALFAASTTGTSTGAVDAFHSSFSPIGGGLLILNMGLGEIAPGGVGSGLYGILMLAVIAVFVAGLMVGRTPEYLRKKITSREIKLVSLYVLVMPVLVLVGTAVAAVLPSARASILNPGPHGLSEMLYAFTSAGNNNGSAFAGLSANTPFYNIGLGVTMLVVRFVPILLVLALAGSLARQKPVPETAGTLATHRPLFVGLLVGVAVIVAALTFFPVIALGPLAEGMG